MSRRLLLDTLDIHISPVGSNDTPTSHHGPRIVVIVQYVQSERYTSGRLRSACISQKMDIDPMDSICIYMKNQSVIASNVQSDSCSSCISRRAVLSSMHTHTVTILQSRYCLIKSNPNQNLGIYATRTASPIKSNKIFTIKAFQQRSALESVLMTRLHRLQTRLHRLILPLAGLSQRRVEKTRMEYRQREDCYGDHPDGSIQFASHSRQRSCLHSVENQKLALVLHQWVAPAACHFWDTEGNESVRDLTEYPDEDLPIDTPHQKGDISNRNSDNNHLNLPRTAFLGQLVHNPRRTYFTIKSIANSPQTAIVATWNTIPAIIISLPTSRRSISVFPAAAATPPPAACKIKDRYHNR